MDAHVDARHLGSAGKQLQLLWGENARLAAAAESEQRLAGASPMSWAFNWRADGWGPGEFKSETRDIGERVSVQCLLQWSACDPLHSHFIGYEMKGIDQCKVHVTCSILDKHDKILRTVHEQGTATAPFAQVFTSSIVWGQAFTPTAEEKAQSVRADGSIRLRAEVRLFLERDASGCCLQ